MARTAIARYTQTYNYLMTVSAVLAQQVDQLVSTMGQSQIGALLSLKGIWSKGHLYKGQHDAIRALMLCQAVYLQWPWARKSVQDSELVTSSEGVKSRVITGSHYDQYALAWQMNVPTSIVRNLSENEIKERILAYVPQLPATRADLARAAKCTDGLVEGQIDYRDYSRASPCRFQHAICYDAVKQFLFKAGFISIRWLTHDGPSLESHTANALLGDGKVANKGELDTVGEGFIFNFHGDSMQGRDNKDVCHWGVTLGGGLGAGTNTTKAAGEKMVTCLQGSLDPGKWGIFRLKESYEVCEIKYGADRGCKTIIRLLDPTAMTGFY
jgi:hypothetical protein